MPTLTQDLSVLEARGLVRVTTERTKPIVRFKHALTREATYNSILQTRRIELHRAAAETLTELYAQPDLEMVLTIAEHWVRGTEDSRALETLLPDAQALIYTGRSLSLTFLLSQLNRENLDEPQQRELDVALADAHAARGEYEPARVLYERALQSTPQGTPRARLLYSLGVAQDRLGEYTRALALHQAGLEIARATNDLVLQAKAMSGLGSVYWSLGDIQNAEMQFQDSAALSAELGNRLELANADYNLALLSVHRGDYDHAIALAERALAVDQGSGHIALTARTYQLLGGCYHLKKDFAHAAEYYQRAVASSRETGDTINLAIGSNNLGELYYDQEKLPQAVEAFSEAAKYFRALHQESRLAGSLANLAAAQNKLAHTATEKNLRDELVAGAQSELEQALRIAQRLNTQDLLGIVYRVRAEVYFTGGDFERAQESARTAVNFLEHSGMAYELENARRTLEEMLALTQTQGE